MTDLLTRYQNGQRDLVWHELARLGDVRKSGRLDEAQAVCDEMAHRARQNVELLVERLTCDGFVFHRNNDEQTPTRPHTPPTTEAVALLAWLEQHVGPVPLTLSSWIRIVGDVWLVGTHPRWRIAQEDGDDQFVLPLAPDHLHKDNTSGGGPCGVLLPDGRADGLFSWENTATPFVSYLNWTFQNGGFPMADDGAQEITNRLARDLLPL